MLKFSLFVHYRVRHALPLNSLCYETPGTKRMVMKRLRYEKSGTGFNLDDVLTFWNLGGLQKPNPLQLRA